MPVLLGLLPAATYALVAYAVRPSAPVFAPVRLTLVRAALIVAGLAEILVEAVSLVHGLTRPALVITWSVGVAAAAAAALLRRSRDRGRPNSGGDRTGLRARWAGLGWAERLLGAGLLVLLLGELTLALASPPNNYDSQTYHLPKIEHWVVDRDVGFFPTAIDRQVAVAPGAEYLLLQLRLLTGGDALYNLLQFAAGVGCVLLASRIAGQLGGSRRAQLLAGFVVATAPIVALEATSTQTDLVTAAWVGCVATLVLDELRRPTAPLNLALIGTAAGLATLTKETALLAVTPLLLVWVAAQARLAARSDAWRGLGRIAAGGTLILGCAAVLAGPYLGRSYAEFGSPFGPDDLRSLIMMQRHDPGSMLINALRIGYTALETPVAALNGAASGGIVQLAHAVGVNPDDPATTFVRSTFPTVNWAPDEDTASLPVAGALVLIGAGLALVRPRRLVPAVHAVPARAYAATFWTGALLYAATVKWQPWGNRLILFLVALGAPLAGLWLDAVLRAGARAPAPVATRLGRSTVAACAALALAVSACAGWLSVGYGWPRRLVGSHTLFTMSDMQARFQRRPQWLADYEWAADAVRASGAHRVGLVQSPDAWEYPWWVLLPGRDIVALQSALPGLPPARPDQVDAILCEVPQNVCAGFAPPGWSVRERNGTGYAVPPRQANSLASSGN